MTKEESTGYNTGFTSGWLKYKIQLFAFFTLVGVRKVQASCLFPTYYTTALFNTSKRQALHGVVGEQKIGWYSVTTEQSCAQFSEIPTTAQGI